MDRKFLIVLFATVFYNGVTQSSPVGQQISDVRLPEEKPPTVPVPTVDHINKKIETVSVPPAKPSAPVSHDATQPPSHVEVPTVKNAATSEIPHVVDGKNATHDANATHPIDNNAMNTTTAGKNVSPVAPEKKNSTQTADSKNSSAPATDNKNASEKPIPTPAVQISTASSTAVPSTTANGTSTTTNTTIPKSTTTVKPATTKPTAPTVLPTATSKDSMITGQNTPAPPAQEKHFDGASFVGGIVLTIGLTAIGFIAFKYYKSGKIDMNYRTL